jgi:hypothetical protein
MKNYLKIISAVVLAFFAFGATAGLATEIAEATPISKEEAAKKYPAPKGGYPTGDRPWSHTPGHILSPYPPHDELDCSKIPHGALVLDKHSNKVFIRP